MNLDSLPWAVIQASSDDGLPVIFRHRTFPLDFSKRDLPHRLNVFWVSPSADETGLPKAEESERMQQFEDRLVEATELDLQSALSLVLTSHGQREYAFHTRDTGDFIRRLTEMPQEPEPYPLEIHHTEDPEWEYVDRALAEIVE